MNNLLVIGKNGQLANELAALKSNNINIVCVGRNDINLGSIDDIAKLFKKYKPLSVVNSTAYTAVDKAEEEIDQAYLINDSYVANIAQICQQEQIHLLHLSTDFVFDGQQTTPYTALQTPNPINVYGQSKRAGEKRLESIDNGLIIRTSWLYSHYGNNFVKTILKLLSERSSLQVVDDQIGSPTWAKTLAQVCYESSIQKITGIHHWSDVGEVNWYEFAVTIQKIAFDNKLIKTLIPIKPISSDEYGLPAKRPKYSVLASTQLNELLPSEAICWKKQLSDCLKSLPYS